MSTGTRPLAGGWVVSFLDLFTCALGGVLLILILSAQAENNDPGTDPTGSFSVVVRFSGATPQPKLESLVTISPAPNLEIAPALAREAPAGSGLNHLVVVTGHRIENHGPRSSEIVIDLKALPVSVETFCDGYPGKLKLATEFEGSQRVKCGTTGGADLVAQWVRREPK